MAHWRNTYQPARFFFMDVRVGVVLMLSLIHVRLWTVTLDIVVVILAWHIERSGLGFMGAMRALRSWLAGDLRPALPSHKTRSTVDFQRRRMAWEPAPTQGPVHLVPINPARSDNSFQSKSQFDRRACESEE